MHIYMHPAPRGLMEGYLHYHVTDKCPHVTRSGRDPQKISLRASATINWNHPFSFSRSATGKGVLYVTVYAKRYHKSVNEISR